MSRRHTGRKRDETSPPDGASWVWKTEELMCSPAWRAQSLECRRFVDALCIENMQHAGTENGNLEMTYVDMVKAGILKRLCPVIVHEAEGLGLVVAQRGRMLLGEKQKSRYRLTWLWTVRKGDYGQPDYARGTDEWKRVTPEAIAKLQAELEVMRAESRGRPKGSHEGTARPEKTETSPHEGTDSAPTREPLRAPTREPRRAKKPGNAASAKVPTWGLSSISRGIGDADSLPAAPTRSFTEAQRSAAAAVVHSLDGASNGHAQPKKKSGARARAIAASKFPLPLGESS